MSAMSLLAWGMNTIMASCCSPAHPDSAPVFLFKQQ